MNSLGEKKKGNPERKKVQGKQRKREVK